MKKLLTLVLFLFLAACSIEGGVPPPATPGALPMTVEPTVTAAPAITAAPADSGVRIGLLDEPLDLLPYHLDASDQRITGPISELLFPAPLLAYNYAYTTTGVLTEVPSVDNGGVEVREVDVYLDAGGSITTTQTDVITKAQQLVVTFRWNPELRWSDGRPVTADDSLFAYELAQQIDLGEDAAVRLALLEAYEVVDDHTTRAVLKPDFTDAGYITTFWTPLPRHLLADEPPATLFDSEFALLPVGYGLFQIERREQGNIRMAPNPYAAGAPAGIDSVGFVFLESFDALRTSVVGGSLDLAVSDRVSPDVFAFLDRDLANELLNVAEVPSPIWEHLDFNLDVALFQDIRVRRAVAHAINREQMTEQLFASAVPVLDSWVLPGQSQAAPASELTTYPFDPDEARRLLDEVGWIDGDGDGIRENNGTPVVVNLLTTDGSALRTAIAEQVRADLNDVGLGVSVQMLPVEQLYSPAGPLFRRQFEMALFAWIASADPGGLGLWSCTAVPNEQNGWIGNNFAGWCFREADQAIRTANTSLDPVERREAYLRQQQLFTQELPALPLFQRLSLVLSSPAIDGLAPDPLAPITWNISEWTRE